MGNDDIFEECGPYSKKALREIHDSCKEILSFVSAEAELMKDLQEPYIIKMTTLLTVTLVHFMIAIKEKLKEDIYRGIAENIKKNLEQIWEVPKKGVKK